MVRKPGLDGGDGRAKQQAGVGGLVGQRPGAETAGQQRNKAEEHNRQHKMACDLRLSI